MRRGTGGRRETRCELCGRPIVLVMVIPTRLRAGRPRSYIPLERTFDPAGPYAPSHALSAGRTTCHPITTDHPLEQHEHPALTHFAVCPARSRPSTAAMEGRPA